MNFSTDGRYVISGDGEGRAFFWDWKTTKIFRSFKAHEGVCIGIEWHPLESSKVRDARHGRRSVPSQFGISLVFVMTQIGHLRQYAGFCRVLEELQNTLCLHRGHLLYSQPLILMPSMQVAARATDQGCMQGFQVRDRCVLTRCSRQDMMQGFKHRVLCLQVATCGWDGAIKYWD